MNNCEICALVFAVCASTGAILQLNINECQEYNSHSDGKDAKALADRFAAEAERYRLMYDYRESTTLNAIHVPLFLHFYYGTKPKPQTTSLLLREAVTLSQFMGLDKEETYFDIGSEMEAYRRRTFWLLYLTERGHAMQHGTGICLSGSIGLPSPDNGNTPHILQAFNSLVHLFASVDGILVDPQTGSGTGGRSFSRETLLRIQSELRQHHEWPAEWNEVQRSDIAITQQWLRMLVWHLSLRHVSMSSESTEDSMSFIYPTRVSGDALKSISTMSMDAVVAHGPGMVGCLPVGNFLKVHCH
ncbi:hypothetical protein N7451_012889 [Penicillium sp. IBT 35674x]|nr:hypothetical protein N7451_012889 [Penicillium sp. IBT 35674x]